MARATRRTRHTNTQFVGVEKMVRWRVRAAIKAATVAGMAVFAAHAVAADFRMSARGESLVRPAGFQQAVEEVLPQEAVRVDEEHIVGGGPHGGGERPHTGGGIDEGEQGASGAAGEVDHVPKGPHNGGGEEQLVVGRVRVRRDAAAALSARAAGERTWGIAVHSKADRAQSNTRASTPCMEERACSSS